MICKRNKFIDSTNVLLHLTTSSEYDDFFETQRNVSAVNKLISFTNHGLFACSLLGINICSEINMSCKYGVMCYRNKSLPFMIS